MKVTAVIRYTDKKRDIYLQLKVIVQSLKPYAKGFNVISMKILLLFENHFNVQYCSLKVKCVSVLSIKD